MQGKKHISAREIVELGIIKSQATLTNWRRRSIGPPCFRLSPDKYIYPVDSFLLWFNSCFVETLPDTASGTDPKERPTA